MDLPFAVDLTGKTAVVTGGTGVLGSYFARALAACGARVAIIGRNEQAARDVIAGIRGEAEFFRGDVTDKASLEAARAEILSRFGNPDILVNGAGGNNPKATTDDETFLGTPGAKDFFALEPDGMKQVFDLNYHGTLLASQVFARDMLGREGACIVNVTSMSAYRPLTKVPIYSGAKAAIINLTMWMAVYFAKAGLRVNAIAPGFYVTSQNRALLFDAQGNPTPRTGKILRATPMDRFGEPEELLGALLFLVSPKASRFVTGVTIPVDGGFSAYAGV
ncbi:MAG TPA: SDR family oxidoreductase [Candidatus Limnocylindria bacterium]|nr:SDR family oxidoreductase [Candidatus Limnocylindria bacterium]